MLLTLKEIKNQLRMDESFTAEDDQLKLYAMAAQKKVEHTTGRKIYATAEDVPDGFKWPIELDDADDIKLAMLALVAHYYNNREATTDLSLVNTPFFINDLLGYWIVQQPELEE